MNAINLGIFRVKTMFGSSLSSLGIGTSIKSGGVKLVDPLNTFPISEMM
jgi:hypothetical protein